MTVSIDSLVLYKNMPAIVRQIADKKLTIETSDGQRVSVRPKDITLLHPGPVHRLSDLQPVQGDAITAWELLSGQPTTLVELAELVFGEFTPSSAWATWQLIEEGLYFSGLPDTIRPHDPGKVEEIRAARDAKAAEVTSWQAFVDRVADHSITADDERYLHDIVNLAMGRTENSRVLRQLGKPQTQESAHEFLLALGYWTPNVNPHPVRLGLPTTQPTSLLNDLPDEPRRDLTHLLALAIDDVGSHDPDDALSLDGDRLWVHIADLAAVVPPDSPADLEARGRGANLYLPEGTIHMLPDALTLRLGLGLQPISPALSFAFTVEENGEAKLGEVVPSWVKVTRTTYENAEARLSEQPFREMLAMTERYRQRRISNSPEEIELPETKIQVDTDGRVTVRPLPPLRSRLVVREAMLMVGEAVGRMGRDHNIPLAFTTQAPPQDIVLPADGFAGMFAQRKAMQRSQQRIAPDRHSGLGLEYYVQVTSPLRRYLDLVNHQQLRSFLRGEPLLTAADLTMRIGAAAVVSGIVRNAERLSNQHWTLVYLMQNPDWAGEGFVVEQMPGRKTVLIPDLAWETELFRRQSGGLNSRVGLSIESIDLPNRVARFRVSE